MAFQDPVRFHAGGWEGKPFTLTHKATSGDKPRIQASEPRSQLVQAPGHHDTMAGPHT